MFVDPFEMIKTVQPGLMLSGVGGPTEEEKHFIFLIREDEKYIKKVGKYPTVQIRMGTFENINNAIGAIVMIRFENNPDLTYDGWLNYHAPMAQIDRLGEQDKLIFKFFTSKDCVRTLAIKNSLKENFIELIEKSKTTKWEMKEFDEVKNCIYQQYDPTMIPSTTHHLR